MHVRPAQEADFPAIKKLIHQVGINPIGLDWGRFILAVSEEGEMIGCGQVKPHGDGSLELASIAVQPAWRHQGIATALIEKLIEKENGPLYLTCRPELESFYARFGFRKLETEELPAYFRRIQRLIRFLKRLRALKEGPLVLYRPAGERASLPPVQKT